MKITQYTVGPIQTNCYFLIEENTKELIIIDPAPGSERLIDIPEKMGLKLVAILLTHAHWDHIDGAEAFHERYGAPRYLMTQETKTAMNPSVNLSSDFGGMDISYEWDQLLSDGQQVSIGGFQFQVFHTPGHTYGGACYYFEKEQVLFSGDSLFEGSIGRTDFPGGSMSELVRSLQEKILTLPEHVKVYPGHGGETEIGVESRYNPYVAGII